MQDYYIKNNVSLGAFNTFHVTASASQACSVNSTQAIQHLCHDGHLADTRLVLGQGSNVLFANDPPGLVVINRIRELSLVNETSDHVWLKVGAGEVWHELVEHCVAHSYGGIENLALIPGCVGAAPVQNIGAYGVELADTFVELEALLIDTCKLVTLTANDCQFEYRDSIFKHELKDKAIITSVTLRLNKNPHVNLNYGALTHYFRDHDLHTLDIKSVFEAVCDIRRSKLPDPDVIGNAGSFFKNPFVTVDTCDSLLGQHPSMPYFSSDDDDDSTTVKLSAAWLIDTCGWKGHRRGDIGVHPHHALVLVNYADNSPNGAAIWQLAQEIQTSVDETFGVTLTPEVTII